MTAPRTLAPPLPAASAVLLAAGLLAAGCLPDDSQPERLAGAHGAMCPEQECRVGLVCSRKGFCANPGEPGAVKEERPCSKDDQCLPALVCGVDGKCHKDEGGVAGAACGERDRCRDDYVCAGDGTCQAPGAAGTGGPGTACADDGACAADFACGLEGACVERDGPSLGAQCRDGDIPCRSDLVCAGDGTCKAPGAEGTASAGTACAADATCARPLVCSTDLACTDPRVGAAAGAPCLPADLVALLPPVPPGVSLPGPCLPDLACAFTGTPLTLAGQPVVVQGVAVMVGECRRPGEPGTAGLGEECVDIAECRLGYICGFGTCFRPVPWAGADCRSFVDPEGPPVAYFKVPRRGAPLAEFFQLPFPNDARIRDDGSIDLSGFPDPSGALPDRTVRRYLDGVAGRRGFGLAGAAIFRFSAQPDINSLYNSEGEVPRLAIVDITPESPEHGETVPMRWGYDSRRGRYICEDHLEIMPMPNAVLRPATTYAAFILNRVRHKDGGAFARDPDFEAMVADAVPDDPDLARAHARYAPLRAWLDRDDTPARDEVLVATVFTTGDPTAAMPRLREAVRGEAAPVASRWVRCGGGAVSPCPAQPQGDGRESADNRDCPEDAAATFDELHGTYPAPVLQKGTRPYLTSDDGGAIEYAGDGTPQVQGAEDICFALTVPRGEGVQMPPAGWPVVIYAHGTGGSFRSFVEEGLAADLARVEVGAPDGVPADPPPDSAVQRFAVLSYDGMMHGPRRNSAEEPDGLFFNVLNPIAARDNSIQGGADVFVAARLVEGLALSADASPTGAEIRFDLSKIYYVGHSQGGNVGALAIPFEPLIHSAVLSGTGAGLILSLLEKRSPVDISAGVRLLLAEDPSATVDTFHPVLNMVQWFVDQADPGSYARFWYREPHASRVGAGPPAVRPPHLFMTYGLQDTYTPPKAMQHLSRAMGLHLAGRAYDESHRLFARDLPVRLNKGSGDQRATGVLQQFQPSGYDGHFVLFRNPDARRRAWQFLGTAARDGVPTLVE